MKIYRLLSFIIILTLFVSPTRIAYSNPPSPVREDVLRSMQYYDKAKRILRKSHNSWGAMLYQTLARFEGQGKDVSFMIALMAKSSGGRKKLMNDNFIGLYQIQGFGPFQRYFDKLGKIVDNRHMLIRPARNIKEGILLLDKILEEIWQPRFFFNIELIKVAERFYCTPNRYEPIVYSCPGSRAWAEDFYYNYLPAVK